MRNKTMAGLLAFIGGYLGLHRFYLGQVGWGIMYLFFFWISWLFGIIDAIVLFSMDEDEFNRRYNKEHREQWDRSFPPQRRRPERAYERQQRREQRRPVSKPRPRPNRKPRSNPYRKAGIEKFKDYDYEEAIKDFNKALEIDPKDIATHFNLACAHSLMENKDKAFYHLDRAVALGFNDWEMIKTRDHLAYLRVQPEFLRFEENGFRLAQQLESPKEDDLLSSQPAVDPATVKQNEDLLDQLQRLAELKEKGLLTDEEFQAQKEKLLR